MSGSGLSKERLSRMRDLMAGYVERGEIPGLVTLVRRGGEVHVDAIGTMAFGGTRPVGRDTIFRISSMTKPVTAAAAMLLIEEDTLELDEPVDRLLPELADRRVLRRLDSPLDDTAPANRAITVRDLLTFRMGIGIVMAMPGTYPIQRAMEELQLGQGPPQPSTPPEPGEWIRRLGTLPLVHQPGERWMYNTGADVLGVLIARASGQTLDAFLRERLFEPLGMHDTGFSVPPEKLDRLPTEYWTDFTTGETVVYDEAGGGKWSRPPAFPSGGAGLVSTVDDFLIFGEMLLNEGTQEGERILSPGAVEDMTRDHLTHAQKAASDFVPGFWDTRGWGFGLSVTTKQDDVGRRAGAFGWDGGLGTVWYSDSAEDLVTILMTQRAWESPNPPSVCLDFWRSAYAAIES